MLPLPFEKYIPTEFKLILDQSPDGQALINFMNSFLTEMKGEFIEVSLLKNILRCPAKFLSELDFYLKANFKNEDDERIKRQKIQNAVNNHKLRGTWKDSAKVVIDNITGLDSQLFKIIGGDDSIFVGDGTEDAGFYWSTFGGDGIDDNLGDLFIGNDEEEIAGIVYIDIGYDNTDLYYFDEVVPGDGVSYLPLQSTIGTDGVTTGLGMYIPGDGATAIDSDVERIKDNLQDLVPAYFRVFLGYTDADGNFIILTEV